MHGNQLCIMKELCEKVMLASHVPPYAGPRGIQTTFKAIETYFYWPTMKDDIHRYVEECVTFQKVKFDRHKTPGLLQPLPIPTAHMGKYCNGFHLQITKIHSQNYGHMDHSGPI